MTNNARFSRLIPAGVAAVLICPAQATFDLMQIEQVIGGVNGDATAQAIQLRMRSPFQCFLQPGRLWVSDAAGANRVLLFDFGGCPAFPVQCVPACDTADRVLIASANFSDFLDAPLSDDFTLTTLIPESYLAAGSLTWEDLAGTIYWRLSWGGDAYTGLNHGSCINDDSICPNRGDFGPPWPGPLPSSGVQALQFQGLADALGTTNDDDYALTAGSAVFTNNAGDSSTVVEPAQPCPCDCADPADGLVNVTDFLFMLGQWGGPGSCDCAQPPDGVVNVTDFLFMLGFWGPCP